MAYGKINSLPIYSPAAQVENGVGTALGTTDGVDVGTRVVDGDIDGAIVH